MLLLLTPSVFAQCAQSSPSSTADFGDIPSFDINLAGYTGFTPDAGLNCNAPLLVGLLGEDTAEATVSSLHNANLVNSASGDMIPFRLFADSALTEEIFIGVPYDYYSEYILGLLGILGSGDSDLPMYFQSAPGGLNLTAGNYTDTLTVNWEWEVCTVSALSLCAGSNSGSFTSVITVTLEIQPDCEISAPDIDFGSAPLVAGFDPVSQNINIRCTKDSDYNVGLNNGSNAVGTQRRMHNAGQYLEYEIYKSDTGLERWGDTGLERRNSTEADTNASVHDGVTSQVFTYQGEISATQTTPASGAYTDSIILEVQF